MVLNTTNFAFIFVPSATLFLNVIHKNAESTNFFLMTSFSKEATETVHIWHLIWRLDIYSTGYEKGRKGKKNTWKSGTKTRINGRHVDLTTSSSSVWCDISKGNSSFCPQPCPMAEIMNAAHQCLAVTLVWICWLIMYELFFF